ncbi:hypothetical protein PHO31112_04732 [Pandoraea horticolens]|uniref:Uncharacterized protein n=1 Tax=Pandoraea horticolens TaxID=2508298 RepID=A0A5E4YUR5_9BURK|nr:hypothetical protein [Pandoraea horticolens]VVE51663.1 hypothetical protein PHO31112_04732 [Pandoraea horticolens]
MIDGSLHQTKQPPVLPRTAKVLQQLLFDLLLGLIVEPADDLHQQINQTIDDFVLSLKTERGRQAIANVGCLRKSQIDSTLAL